MKLTAICIGAAERLPGKSMKTGIFKQPLTGTVFLDENGLLGDAVCNRKHHGGPDQAILLEGSLTLDWWAARLHRPMPPGAFGENLVVDGLDNRDVAVGDRFVIGEAVLEATMARIPCNTLNARMEYPGFGRLYREAARPGLYCRVLKGGALHAGQDVSFEPYAAGERIAIAALLAVGKSLPEVERRRLLAAPIAERLRRLLEG